MPDDARRRAVFAASPHPLTGAHSRWRAVRGYLALPHFVAIVVVLVATAAFAFIAWGGMPPLHVLTPMLLAMLGGQLVVGVTNELVDYADDARYKPHKPLPSGAVSLRGAWVTLIAGLMLMVGFGHLLGLYSFALLVAGNGLGVVYDLWLKRTQWSWLPYLLALPLLPIWVFVTLGRAEPELLLLYPLGGLATIGVHFAQALPDVAGDRAAGLVTPTSQLGANRVFWLAWLASLSAPTLAWLAARWLHIDAGVSAIVVAAGVTLVSLAVNVGVMLADRNAGIRLCFPLIAVATLLNGLAWVWTVAQ